MLAIDLVDLLPADVAASVRERAQQEQCSEIDVIARAWRDYQVLASLLAKGVKGFMDGVAAPVAPPVCVAPEPRRDWVAPSNIEEAVIGVVMLDRVELLPEIRKAVGRRYGWPISTKTIDTTCARLARRGELQRVGPGQYRAAA